MGRLRAGHPLPELDLTELGIVQEHVELGAVVGHPAALDEEASRREIRDESLVRKVCLPVLVGDAALFALGFPVVLLGRGANVTGCR